MRVQRYDMDVKDDNGSKELVDLRNRNTFVKPGERRGNAGGTPGERRGEGGEGRGESGPLNPLNMIAYILWRPLLRPCIYRDVIKYITFLFTNVHIKTVKRTLIFSFKVWKAQCLLKRDW